MSFGSLQSSESSGTGGLSFRRPGRSLESIKLHMSLFIQRQIPLSEDKSHYLLKKNIWHPMTQQLQCDIQNQEKWCLCLPEDFLRLFMTFVHNKQELEITLALRDKAMDKQNTTQQSHQNRPLLHLTTYMMHGHNK